ncbi:hypothetical protein L2E82_45115 [Cichorium intybus]|uniref:Uncharacterized protein n=1 Tax=Cichorium intybus TaxID=13427 RepID=A0ACB8ZSZ8_CICIN|nr:hypothetical protein L2E82_45115 [Cichorium intybus]
MQRSKMTVVGFDLGNESCVVAVVRQRGIDIVLNDESKSEMPALVCFGEKQRFLGTAGTATNRKVCIRQRRGTNRNKQNK